MRRVLGAVVLGLGLAAVVGCGGADVEPPPPPSPGASDPRPESDQNRTGAGKTVSGTTAGGQAVGTLEEMFSRVPGLQVVRLTDGGFSLRIRGGSASLLGGGGNSEPLVVVDGMPLPQGDLSRTFNVMDPQQVDRIEVLRDASSIAVYGTRGAHGVVLITMKRRSHSSSMPYSFIFRQSVVRPMPRRSAARVRTPPA